MLTLVLHKLPSELLYAILLDIIRTSIHSVGLGRGTEWDTAVFTTLAGVSIPLEGVAHKLAANIFGLNEQENGQSIIRSADELMQALHQLSQPDSGRWDAIVTRYPDKYPSDIFKAYSLLNSAISLRHGSSNNPMNAFIVAQNFALDALDTLEKMNSCRITTAEISSALRLRCTWEKKILAESIKLVHTCDRITSLLAVILPPNPAQSQWQLVSQDEPARNTELSGLLLAAERRAINYEHACSQAGEPQNTKSIQLPGVAEAMHNVSRLLQHPQCTLLTPSITSIISRWERTACPLIVS